MHLCIAASLAALAALSCATVCDETTARATAVDNATNHLFAPLMVCLTHFRAFLDRRVCFGAALWGVESSLPPPRLMTLFGSAASARFLQHCPAVYAVYSMSEWLCQDIGSC